MARFYITPKLSSPQKFHCSCAITAGKVFLPRVCASHSNDGCVYLIYTSTWWYDKKSYAPLD